MLDGNECQIIKLRFKIECMNLKIHGYLNEKKLLILKGLESDLDIALGIAFTKYKDKHPGIFEKLIQKININFGITLTR